MAERAHPSLLWSCAAWSTHMTGTKADGVAAKRNGLV